MNAALEKPADLRQATDLEGALPDPLESFDPLKEPGMNLSGDDLRNPRAETVQVRPGPANAAIITGEHRAEAFQFGGAHGPVVEKDLVGRASIPLGIVTE